MQPFRKILDGMVSEAQVQRIDAALEPVFRSAS